MFLIGSKILFPSLAQFLSSLKSQEHRLLEFPQAYGIHTLIGSIPSFPSAKRNKRFVCFQERLQESISPVNTQPWVSNLNPAVDITHQCECSRKYVTQQQTDGWGFLLTDDILDHNHGIRSPLSAKRAKYKAPHFFFARGADCITT